MATVYSNLQLLGNAAKKAGVSQCYYYPGMHADAFAEAIDASVRPSLNERIAFEFGYGASLAGNRTAVVCKGVGLAACLDSLHHSVLAGVRGGLVVVVLEDTVAASSPEIVDSRLLLDYVATMMIEPSSMKSALAHIQSAFSLSEDLDVPILVRLTYDLLNTDNEAFEMPGALSYVQVPSINFREKMIGPWSERSRKYEAKLDRICQYTDAIYSKQVNRQATTFIFGSNGPNTKNGLIVEHYPIAQVLKNWFKKGKISVQEVGSNYALQCLYMDGAARVDNSRVKDLSVTPLTDWARALEKVDKKRYGLVVGDEGRFTFDSTGLIDICLCMGSSIAVCAGMSKSYKNLAIIGDFAYLFNGYSSILEAYWRKVDMDIVLLDDGKAASTGGQKAVAEVDCRDIERYLAGYYVYDYNKLPPSHFVQPNSRGITLYHIKKR